MPAGILLDIEGTTSSISFVHEVMFPFALEQLDTFLERYYDRDDVRQACETIARDAGHASLADWAAAQPECSAQELVKQEVRSLMERDEKATGLKQLQGLIWQGGFESGQLRAHVYPDVIPAIKHWRQHGVDVRIYSSGSVAAQRLFFGHLDELGNCLELFSGHYDTTIGSKKEADSYRRIAADWGVEPAELLFISDVAGELEAAQSAGFQTVASVRPGNPPLPADYQGRRLTTFDDVACG